MKKILYTSLLALSILACSKTTTDDGSDIDTSGHTIFQALFENVKLTGEKDWAKGDLIGVFGSELGDNTRYEIEKSCEETKTANFYGPVVKGDILAYHPYDRNMVCEGGKLQFLLADVQDFSRTADAKSQFLEYCNTSFASPDESGTFLFKFPLGILSVMFDFNPGIEVKEMRMSCDRGLAGKMFVGKDCQVTASGIAYKTIVLNFNGDVVPSINDGRFTEFLFVIPPSTYKAGELTLDVEAVGETLHLAIPECTVPRVDASDFHVTAIKLGTDGLEEFDGKEGYLE